MPRDEIRIVPDPAIEGRLVTIHLPDGGPWFISRDPSGEIEPLPTVGTRAEVMAPGVGGQTFTIINLTPPVTSAGFDIVSQDP